MSIIPLLMVSIHIRRLTAAKYKQIIRNPVILAIEMQEIMERNNISRAELARKMKVSRARILQILNLQKLSHEVIEMIKGLGDNLKRPVITERRLRVLGRQVSVGG
jgi:hypothetical protein